MIIDRLINIVGGGTKMRIIDVRHCTDIKIQAQLVIGTFGNYER